MQQNRTRQGSKQRIEAGAGVLSLRVLGSATRYSLTGPLRGIGTAQDNDLVLSDPYVSRRHARLCWRDDGSLWIEDLGSRNGTWVNDLRVERCVLRPRSRLALGHTVLEVVEAAAGQQKLGLVGAHPLMKRVAHQVRRFAAVPHPALILGETGTGKELVARALHRLSSRGAGSFEALNCAAIPGGLAESELFGHARGAFTGAERSHDGAFLRADGGTLLLDEIGEMPLPLQAKLLRALEDGQVQPVGAADRRRVSIRVLAATHRDLEKEAMGGGFRFDLFHRLAVCVIRLPPLRERRSDIPLLVEHFLERMSVGAPRPIEISDSAMALLREHSWPGNVRQLQAALQQAHVLGGHTLRRGDFSALFGRACDNIRSGYVKVSGRSFASVQRAVYVDAIQRHEGNRTAAAQELGVPKSTFFDHLRALGITPSEWGQ